MGKEIGKGKDGEEIGGKKEVREEEKEKGGEKEGEERLYGR